MDELVELNSDLVASATPTAMALAEVYFINRYPGFDLDDPDWPAPKRQIEQTAHLLATVKGRVQASAKP